jgi:hypothetical protein
MKERRGVPVKECETVETIRRRFLSLLPSSNVRRSDRTFAPSNPLQPAGRLKTKFLNRLLPTGSLLIRSKTAGGGFVSSRVFVLSSVQGAAFRSGRTLEVIGGR